MGFSFSNFFYGRGPRTPAHANARRGPQRPPHFAPEPPGFPPRPALTPGKCLLLPHQFDRLWSEMPINAKGRLRYPDFLSRFGSEKVATPPATGDSAKAHRGSSVPEVSDGNRSAASSPTRDLKAATKQRSHPCVSPPPPLSPVALYQAHESPWARGPHVPTGCGVTEKVAQHEPGAGVPGEEPPGGSLAFAWRIMAGGGGGRGVAGGRGGKVAAAGGLVCVLGRRLSLAGKPTRQW